MSANIWLISKYIAPARDAKVGARGFFLLREFVRRGHRSLLITSDSNHVANTPSLETSILDETIDGVQVRWLRTLKYVKPSSIKRLLSWFDFEWQLLRMPNEELPRPDIIIVSSLSIFTVLNGIRLRRRYSCKLVFEVRDIWPLLLYAAGNISPNHPVCLFLGVLEKLGYRSADLIVGTMPNLVEHVEEITGEKRPVVCVPQGIEDSHLSTPTHLPEDYVKAYIPRERFIVCYAGSIGRDNALEPLFDCAKAMVDRIQIHFLIVGDGYLKKHFQEICADLTNVTFAPRVEKSALQSVLSQVDLLFLSVHNSPALRFGQSLNKLIDYMVAGKPILASYTGYPSMINEANCGTIVSVGDLDGLISAIDYYADLPANERALIGERGRTWLFANRCYEKLADDYLSHLGVTKDSN